jgi:predicted branched-subunit amino acid permease
VPFGWCRGGGHRGGAERLAQAIGMSYLVYAGSAQLAALQLIALGSPFVPSSW